MDNSKNYNTPYTIDLESLQSESAVKEYMDQVKRCPPSILALMTNESTADFLEDNLGPTFGIEESAVENITRIIKDVLLGKLFAGDITQTIIQTTGADQTTAQKIRDKIVKELFAPALEEIKKIQREKFPDRTRQGTTSEPTNTTPPPTKEVSSINQSNVINLRQDSNS